MTAVQRGTDTQLSAERISGGGVAPLTSGGYITERLLREYYLIIDLQPWGDLGARSSSGINGLYVAAGHQFFVWKSH